MSRNLIHSEISEHFDSRPAEIISFITKDYPDLVAELNEYSKNINDNHRLYKNYKNINFSIFPFVSMWKRKNKIVGFATGWNRDIYPKNSIRIFNRFYHDKSLARVKFSREILRPSTLNCLNHQIELSKNLGYDYIFMSREPRTNKYFKEFVNGLNSKTDLRWEFKEGPFLVAPNPNDISCWQTIVMAELKKSENNFWKHWKTK